MQKFLFTLLSISCLFAQIQSSDVTIARDKWGTPHIFGKTDADVAYGLAWANCEDNFFEVQEMLLVGTGKLGRVKGAEGAKADYFVLAIDAKATTEKNWEKLPADYLRYVAGYVQGLNDYAKSHKKGVRLKSLFPVSDKDLVQTYSVIGSALIGSASVLGKELKDLVKDKKQKEKDSLELYTSVPLFRTRNPDYPAAFGSNAYAMNAPKSEDGNTYICGNPHFLVGEALSFYEAHLMSEEGMNVQGALFHGSHAMAMACNDSLAWSQTYNYYDGVDVYNLVMHPTEPFTYKMEGEWKKLRVETRKLYVKIAGVVVPIKKEFYWSEHGPVFQRPDKSWFALRCKAFDNIQLGEQTYRMCKAQNWTQFRQALDMQQMPLFNLVYADKDENIFYLSNGLFPKRNPKYDPFKPFPGDVKDAIWTEIYPIDSLPHIQNPKCGYVYNANNTPYHTTAIKERIKPILDKSFDLRPGDNNRSIRLYEQINEVEKMDFRTFKKMKYDKAYSEQSVIYKELHRLQILIHIAAHPELKEVFEELKNWDYKAEPTSTGATVAGITLGHIIELKHWGDEGFVNGFKIDSVLFLAGLKHCKQYLERNFKSVHVPLQQAFRYQHKEISWPGGGFSDVLMASYYKEDKKHFSTIYGDSYIFFAKFGKKKLLHLETLSPYSHAPDYGYESQMPLYLKGEARTMLLHKKAILQLAKKVYSPNTQSHAARFGLREIEIALNDMWKQTRNVQGQNKFRLPPNWTPEKIIAFFKSFKRNKGG